MCQLVITPVAEGGVRLKRPGSNRQRNRFARYKGGLVMYPVAPGSGERILEVSNRTQMRLSWGAVSPPLTV